MQPSIDDADIFYILDDQMTNGYRSQSLFFLLETHSSPFFFDADRSLLVQTNTTGV